METNKLSVKQKVFYVLYPLLSVASVVLLFVCINHGFNQMKADRQRRANDDYFWLEKNNYQAKVLFTYAEEPWLHVLAEGVKDKTSKKITLYSEAAFMPMPGEVWEIGQKNGCLVFVKKQSKAAGFIYLANQSKR